MDKDKLIEKWLNNELTDAEMETFEQRDDYELNLAILENAKHFKASEISTVEEFYRFKEQYEAKKASSKNLHWLSPILKIAAILVIALGIYFTFFFNNMVEVKTLASEKTTVELPDHSTVTLNALSEIEYDKNRWNDKRELHLDGEAFFKVTKGKTFDVITKDGVVTVVGTQFNVKQRDHYFEVKCFEGKVQVSSNGKDKLLKVGDTYQILNGKYIASQTTSAAPAWIENRSVFEAIPLKEVLAELERQYNIEITYKSVNADRLFTGGFVHNNLENALISITKPMNLTYELKSSKL
ncbi:MAG TPA: FecR family protein, partial [Flavobacteriaceae bacterium]|nr:FecR family protein [Flavobacteriaceae bacterium]